MNDSPGTDELLEEAAKLLHRAAEQESFPGSITGLEMAENLDAIAVQILALKWKVGE